MIQIWGEERERGEVHVWGEVREINGEVEGLSRVLDVAEREKKRGPSVK